jgi:hypothetical protein
VRDKDQAPFQSRNTFSSRVSHNVVNKPRSISNMIDPQIAIEGAGGRLLKFTDGD